MFAVLCEIVALCAPEFGVIVVGCCGFGEEDKGAGEVVDVDVVPAGLATTDDGALLDL